MCDEWNTTRHNVMDISNFSEEAQIIWTHLVKRREQHVESREDPAGFSPILLNGNSIQHSRTRDSDQNFYNSSRRESLSSFNNDFQTLFQSRSTANPCDDLHSYALQHEFIPTESRDYFTLAQVASEPRRSYDLERAGSSKASGYGDKRCHSEKEFCHDLEDDSRRNKMAKIDDLNISCTDIFSNYHTESVQRNNADDAVNMDRFRSTNGMNFLNQSAATSINKSNWMSAMESHIGSYDVCNQMVDRNDFTLDAHNMSNHHQTVTKSLFGSSFCNTSIDFQEPESIYSSQLSLVFRDDNARTVSSHWLDTRVVSKDLGSVLFEGENSVIEKNLQVQQRNPLFFEGQLRDCIATESSDSRHRKNLVRSSSFGSNSSAVDHSSVCNVVNESSSNQHRSSSCGKPHASSAADTGANSTNSTVTKSANQSDHSNKSIERLFSPISISERLNSWSSDLHRNDGVIKAHGCKEKVCGDGMSNINVKCSTAANCDNDKESSENTRKRKYEKKSKEQRSEARRGALDEAAGELSSIGSGMGKRRLKNILDFSQSEQNRIMKIICGDAELLLTLLHSDFSTSMRRTSKVKNGKENEEAKVISLVVLCERLGKSCHSDEMMCVSFPFLSRDNKHYKLVRDYIDQLMLSKHSTKIGFGVQELMKSLITHFTIDKRKVLSDWYMYDIKIATWLLDPDHPVSTVDELLKLHPHLAQKLHNVAAYSSDDSALAADIQLLSALHSRLAQQLKASQRLWQLYCGLECSLCPLLAVMELHSISVDMKLMKQSCSVLKSQMESLEGKIYKAAGHKFCINSHSQLREVIFTELRLDAQCPDTKLARTSVGKLKSTSESVLRKMKGLHPLPGLVLEYRQCQKLKSTYVDGLMAYIARSGELSTHWDHTAAATGRLTSTSPNLQSVPKLSIVKNQEQYEHCTQVTTDDGAVKYLEVFAREPFVSKPGWSFLAADFQQIELRILSHLSNDSRMLKLFSNTKHTDVFSLITSQWLNKLVDDVMTSEREQTKRVVYSVMYGVGKERLAEYLETTADDAKNIMQSFLITFPGINQFRRKCLEETKKLGYNSTLFGRRRLYPNINHSDFNVRSVAERQAVNFCMQGTSADICKAAMIQVKKALIANPDRNARMLIQIHDELLLEVENKDLDFVAGMLKEIMESPKLIFEDFGTSPMRVPLKVSLSAGSNWGHMSSYGKH